MGEILDGKKVAAEVRAEVERDVESLRGTTGVTPTLATVLVGDDPGSHLYVSNKEKACRQVGITSEGYRPPAAVSEDELLGCVESLNRRADIHGILVQLPLPPGLDAARVIAAIAPAKDVDGLHPYNQGRLLAGADGPRPCTPLGIMRLIDTAGVTLRGARAAVVGRSTLVGKPVALLLLERHATVTMCHSRTRELAAEVSAADVVVAATGSPGLVRGEWIRPGSVVIDVGINRGPDGRLRGDVEFEAARERAAFITPVPGGVGPMTVAMLLANTVRAARQQLGVAHDG